MKKFGSWRRLFQIGFARNMHDVLLQPDTTTTYTADRVIQLPKGDADQQLTSITSEDTLKNKTISGHENTLTDISMLSLEGTLPVTKGGTNSSTALTGDRIMQSSGGAIIEAPAITAQRALVSDEDGIPTHSVVTSTELARLSGVTSAIQGQIDGKQDALGFVPEDSANKGMANGYCPLNASAKIDATYLDTSVMNYHGSWDADTNTPPLSNGMVGADPGDVYIVNVAGTHDFGDGPIDFGVGDWVIYSQTNVWQRIANTSDVTSVNGAQGAVTVNAISELTGDVTAGPASGSQSKVAIIATGAITNDKIAIAAGIDATKLGDGSVDNSELSHLHGVTSSIQPQLDSKASRDLSNLTALYLQSGALLVGSSPSTVIGLPAGSNGQVLSIVGGVPTWSVPNSLSYVTTWNAIDGHAKPITHNLDTLDVMIQVYDLEDGQTIEVDQIIRVSTNSVFLSASEAPNATGWRVLITAVIPISTGGGGGVGTAPTIVSASAPSGADPTTTVVAEYTGEVLEYTLHRYNDATSQYDIPVTFGGWSGVSPLTISGVTRPVNLESENFRLTVYNLWGNGTFDFMIPKQNEII